MNESQLAALTDSERRVLGLQKPYVLRDWLVDVLTALADARLEVARLTEERDALAAAIGAAESNVAQIARAEAERDRQREDIRRLMEALDDEHIASGCDDSLGSVCATSLLLAEMKGALQREIDHER